MPKRGDYLYRRKGSQNWYLRIQFPEWLAKKEGKAKIERSLGTSDRQEAELLAFDEIRDHKYALFLMSQFKNKTITSMPGPRRYEPGKLHHNEAGESILASETILQFYSADGELIRTEDNSFTVKISMNTSSQDARMVAPYIPVSVSSNDEIIETWSKHRSINRHLHAEAIGVWRLFGRLVNGRPLSKCTREDGRKLSESLMALGNSTSTVEKKIGHLRAAVNLAIDEGRLSSNPFIRVVPKLDDRLERCPLSDNDMSLIRCNMNELSEHDQLLLRILSSTGMRLSEAFQITSELHEDSVRYVIIGTKTKSSKRRVPFPEETLSHLPTTVVGPLFTGDPEVAGKRLRYFLRGLGISFDSKKATGDRRKVVHSLRHRMKDKLRAIECPLDVQYELLGHENRTVAAGYGHGSPISKLKYWLDRIQSCYE